MGSFAKKMAKLSCDDVMDEINRPLNPDLIASEEALHVARMFQTFAFISRCALTEKSKLELYEGKLRGMVNEVGDTHSQFFSAKELDAFYEVASGEFFGIGVELEPELLKGKLMGVKIIAPMPDTPAERAGLKAGDELFEINGVKVMGLKDFDAFMDLMRGPLGSTVKLTVLRNGQKAPLMFTIVREKITQEFLKVEMLHNGWAWIRVRQFFGLDMCAKMESSYKKLAQKNTIKGVVLDLRNNPGGQLQLALCMVEAFAPKSLKDKPMIAAQTRDRTVTIAEISNPKDIQQGKPLIVLVNAGSASASEIVAKSLQGWGIGTVAGTRSFGKGSIQSLVPIADKAIAVKLTIAQYLIYHSSGVLMPVQGVGVMPNIIIQGKSDTDMLVVHEEDFSGAIATNTAAKDVPPVDTKKKNPALYQKIMDVLHAPELKVEFE
jgi:carboxyl-terminal processing protease